jgi:hypothetical protein
MLKTSGGFSMSGGIKKEEEVLYPFVMSNT